MTKSIDLNSIDPSVKSKVYTQNYLKNPAIEGVTLIELSTHTGEEGYLVELLRLDNGGCLNHFPKFKLAQIILTKMHPGSIKGWHLHMRQDDIWCVRPDSHLLVGLWDVRSHSSTKGTHMRLAMGEGKTQLLFIPRGVAHGAANVSGKMAEMLYLINQTFQIDDPDELRLPWDSLGKDFWTPKRD